MPKYLDKLLQEKVNIVFSDSVETTAQSLTLKTARIFTHLVMSEYWNASRSSQHFQLRKCSIIKSGSHKLLKFSNYLCPSVLRETY